MSDHKFENITYVKEEQHPQPFKSVLRLLSWFCPAHLYEEIEGDLIQRFQLDVKLYGERKAKRKFAWNAIRFLRPGIVLRNKFSFELNQAYLLRSYFKIAYRQLIKSKAITLINVMGLSIGIASFLLILQYVSYEMSYDQFHSNKDEIYRVTYSQYENGELRNASAKNFIGIRGLLKENFPEVKSTTAFWMVPANTGFVFGYQNKTYLEPGNFLKVDSGFFDVFPELLAKGNRKQVLNDAHNLIISEKIAKKIFTGQDPINQRIVDVQDHDNNGGDFVISGIIKDIPENAHFHADFISIADTNWDTLTYYWDTPSFYTYVTIPEKTDVRQFEGRLNALLKQLSEKQVAMKGCQASLQPLTSIHLNSHLEDELEVGGNTSLIFILSSIGVIILIIAWINYINLETAQFITKVKEIGVRRVIGSTKQELALQFLIKYLCINFLAGILAMALLGLILPHFTYITGIPISGIQWRATRIGLMALSIFVAGSFLVGIYPSIFLSKLNSVAHIKGSSVVSSGQGRYLRKSLVVIQFTASLVLIAFLLVISQQLDFMRVSNKKIDVDHIIALENAMAYSDDLFEIKQKEFDVLENKLQESPAIKQVSSSSAIPGTEIGFTLVNEIKKNKSDPYDPTRFKLLFIDHNFIPLYNLKLKAGRNYLSGNDDDENNGRIILNESAIHALGFNTAEEAIGKEVSFPLWPWMKPMSEIIGVVEDYHHESVKKSVMPMIFFLNGRGFQQVYFSIRITAGSNPTEALSYVERTWKKIFPERPFHYFFLDNYYDQQFKSELYFGRVFGLFAGVAVFLACLGILGTTMFEANARLKEVSIRKVLGASVKSILALFSRDLFSVAIISFLVACPLIYLAAAQWLANYPVRINITAMIFALPVVVITVLIIFTSGFLTWKVANSSPVDHLKHE